VARRVPHVQNEGTFKSARLLMTRAVYGSASST
jgi:hypothetical protein